MDVEKLYALLSEQEQNELDKYILDKTANRVTIEDFVQNNKMSTRLYNVLMNQLKGRHGIMFKYVSDIDKRFFLLQNAGNKSWNELLILLEKNGIDITDKKFIRK